MNKFFKSANVQWLIFAVCIVMLFVIFRLTSGSGVKETCDRTVPENLIKDRARQLPSDAVTTDSFFGYQFGSEVCKGDEPIDGIVSHGQNRETVARRRVDGLPTGLDELKLHYTAKSGRLYRINSKKISTSTPLTKERLIADAEVIVSIFTNAFPNSVRYDPGFNPSISTRNLYASGRVGNLQFVICIYLYETSQWIDFELFDERMMDVARREVDCGVKRDKNGQSSPSASEMAASFLGSLIFLTVPICVGFAVSFGLVCLVQFILCSARKRNFVFHFSWPDVLMIILPALTWGCLEQAGNGKSLSNVIELPIIGMAMGLCYGFKLVGIYFIPRVRPLVWSVLGVALMVVVATLMALYFPCLPE